MNSSCLLKVINRCQQWWSWSIIELSNHTWMQSNYNHNHANNFCDDGSDVTNDAMHYYHLVLNVHTHVMSPLMQHRPCLKVSAQATTHVLTSSTEALPSLSPALWHRAVSSWTTLTHPRGTSSWPTTAMANCGWLPGAIPLSHQLTTMTWWICGTNYSFVLMIPFLGTLSREHQHSYSRDADPTNDLVNSLLSLLPHPTLLTT